MPRTVRLALALLTSLVLAVTMLPLATASADEGVVPDVFLRERINSDSFNRTGYPLTAAEMATVDTIQHTSAYLIKSFEGIEYATSLESLTLVGATVDLSFIAQLPTLKRLTIVSPTLRDLSFLRSLPHLEYLSLESGVAMDLTPLSQLTGLTDLSITGPAMALQSLRPLTNVTTLMLQTPVRDLAPLTGMTGMTQLVLDDTGIADLKALAGMTKMEYLVLRGNAITSVAPLSGMQLIQHLYLDGNAISDVRPLAGLTSLKKLELSGNRITDLSSLAPLTGRVWAAGQSLRVKAANGSRYAMPRLRDSKGQPVAWAYPQHDDLVGHTVPATVPVDQAIGTTLRYEWRGVGFSGELAIDVVDAITPPTSTVPTTPPAGPTPVDVYTTPGDHFVNGRNWRTRCEKYSATTRCTTLIEATQVKQIGGRFVPTTAYVFNNLTYLPAPRALWKGNPLATAGTHVIDGRTWQTDCDTPVTGRNGCRSSIEARVIEAVPSQRGGGYTYRWTTKFVLNNIVRFS